MSTLPLVPPGTPTILTPFSITDDEFDRLRAFIRAHTGIALSEHKRALVCSRLGKRLRYHNLTGFSEYYTLLTQHDAGGSELVEMINAITTNKTEFFRESHHFDFLTEHLFARAGAERMPRVRLWSAGTSSGEEAYSLAMTVREAFSADKTWDIRILASDIDTSVLQNAERGVYNCAQAARIPNELLQKYFYQGRGANAGYVKAKPALQELIRFRHLNLLDDPWPVRGPFDAILCRNVVIYFDRATQLRLIERFTRLLKPQGYLLLGHSESLTDPGMALRHVGHSIYQHTGAV